MPTSSGCTVSIDSYHNYIAASEAAKTDPDFYGAKAETFAHGGAVLAVKVTTSFSESHADVGVTVDDDATLSASGAVKVRALSNNESHANSYGLIVGLIGGFGATVSTSDASGDTLVTLEGRVTGAFGLTEDGAHLGRPLTLCFLRARSIPAGPVTNRNAGAAR